MHRRLSSGQPVRMLRGGQKSGVGEEANREEGIRRSGPEVRVREGHDRSILAFSILRPLSSRLWTLGLWTLDRALPGAAGRCLLRTVFVTLPLSGAERREWRGEVLQRGTVMADRSFVLIISEDTHAATVENI